jgi:hypothetical protein
MSCFGSGALDAGITDTTVRAMLVVFMVAVRVVGGNADW